MSNYLIILAVLSRLLFVRALFGDVHVRTTNIFKTSLSMGIGEPPFSNDAWNPKKYLTSQLLQVARTVLTVAGSTAFAQNVYAINEAERKPEITHKVFLDIKIANYTEESTGTNRGANGSGRIVFGLFGKDSPLSVQLFLETLASNGTEVPSFIASQFSRINEDGVLEVEKIRGINSISIAGEDNIEYGGRVMDYKPILESNGIKHDRRGLLTRQQLSKSPEFGITMKPADTLDTFHIVFGTMLEGQEVKIKYTYSI